MHDVGAALHRAPQARRIRHVARRKLDAPRRELRAALGAADERAHVEVPGAQRVDDLRSDETGGARDEDLHVVKFCQYRDGVGPRWPWYFEPSDELP
jgi:hypothetical protein